MVIKNNVLHYIKTSKIVILLIEKVQLMVEICFCYRKFTKIILTFNEKNGIMMSI